MGTANLVAQSKTFIDQPYLETTAKVDTLVKPDLIFLDILIQEKDSKNKLSVEELENKMALALEELGIDIKSQLTVSDLASSFKHYFLKSRDVMKSKVFQLKVFDAQTAGKVIVALENDGISNIELARTDYSNTEALKLELKTRAMLKAKNQGESLLRPLNQKLGSAIHVIDREFTNFNDASSLDEVVIVGYSAKNSQATEPLNIEFAPIKIQTEVTVKFKIEH